MSKDRIPDIFDVEAESKRADPLPDMRPWYQRWFGWAVPSERAMEGGIEAGGYIGLLAVFAVLTIGVKFGIGFAIGYGIGVWLEQDPHLIGAIVGGVALFVGGGSSKD